MARSSAISGTSGSTARVNSVEENTTAAMILRVRVGVMVVPVLVLVPKAAVAALRSALGDLVEARERAQQSFQFLERYHVGSVGRCLVGILVGLDEHAGDAD